MSVNKRILEQKTNQELEDYIKPESKFIDLAKIYAFEPDSTVLPFIEKNINT